MIESRMVFALRTNDQGGMNDIPLPCTLKYNPSNPFEVTMTFHIAGGDNVWTFGREILIAGRDAVEGMPAGLSDVKAWVFDDEYHLEFKSHEGAAHVFTASDHMDEFISETLLSIPEGQEVMHDMDRELEQLLRQ